MAADADLAAVSGALAQEFPKTNAGRGVAIEPMRDVVIGGELRRTSMLFLGVVGLRPAHLLRQRRQPAAGARHGAHARAGGPHGARRRPAPGDPAAAHGKPAAGERAAARSGSSWARRSCACAGTMIPQGLLPAAVTLTFDLRVVTFCAAAALVVGVLFGLAPAWQATSISSVAGARLRRPRDNGPRRTLPQRRSSPARWRPRCAALRRRPAAAHAARGDQRRSRLPRRERPDDDRRSAGVEVSDARRPLQFYDAIEREVASLPGVRGVALGEHPAARDVVRGPDLLRDRRRSAAAREPDAGRRLPDRQPVVLPRARSADRDRPRLRRPRYICGSLRSASSTRPSSAPTSRGVPPSACSVALRDTASPSRRRSCGRSSAWRDR